MKHRVFIGLSAALALAACASAGGQAGLIPLWKDFSDHPAGYLGAAAPDAYAFLSAPPAKDSPAGAADLGVYRATRSLQGTPRWNLATQDADVETVNAPGKVFDCALGATLDIQRQPVLMRLLARVMKDADVSVKAPKEHYQRPRPFLTDDGPICVAKEDWLVKQGSYPSGHAATGWAWALVLSEMEPAKSEAVLKRGLEYGESRVVCGVHYVSDIWAGRTAGAATLARLKTDPAFMADYRKAKAELDAALASGARPPAGKCEAEKAALAERPF
jgi:acid phosphatase (class A)